ncbi:MAG: hypothetical protein PHO63_00530 [Bacilli bacterium]|nr:hypothetical protein [Bacilli bacterium]MDD4809201.1 hypothetical protein [Bacilli bacterium]
MNVLGWFYDIFRNIFLFLDRIVYWLVDQIYRLFILIADTGVLSPETIQEFGNRIYILLAIIMIFIVSFSLIKYIINPDDFLDSQKGVGKLLTNFFIVLITIVAVPTVFKLAFELQGVVLSENIIGKIIIGNGADNLSNPDGNEITDGGKTISSVVFAAFYKPNEDAYGPECQFPDYDCHLNGGTGSEDDVKDIPNMIKTRIGTDSKKDVVNLIDDGIVNEKVIVNDPDNPSEEIEVYAIDYIFIISAVAGLALAYVLLVFCFDLAIRSVKLGFLQIIAPIPIVSLLDPRQKGNNSFNNWVKSCISTYLGLFVRLIAIYFAIYLCTIIANSDGEIVSITNQATNPGDNILVKVFLIFGALYFAKELPKMLEDLTGMKLDGGNMSLKKSPVLGAAKVALGAGLGVGGLAAGGALAAKGNWDAMRAEGGSVVKSGLSAVRGLGAGGVRGMVGGATGGRAGIHQAIQTTRSEQERGMKAQDADYGVSARNKDRLAIAKGGATRAQQMEDAAKDFEKGEVFAAKEALFKSEQELNSYTGFSDDGQRLHLTDQYGTVTQTLDTTTDIDNLRNSYMNEYKASPGVTPQQEQKEKIEYAAGRLAEVTGVSESEFKIYEQKIKVKEAKEAAINDYRTKKQDAHDKENELAKMKISAEKQKKLQESYGIGVTKEKPKQKTKK